MHNVKSILVIEDDATSRTVLTRLLTRDGYVAVGVATIQQACEVVRHSPVDLVLVDWYLREGTALDAAVEIRKHAPDVPFILMSGLPVEAIEHAERLGARCALEKPFTREELRAALSDCSLHPA